MKKALSLILALCLFASAFVLLPLAEERETAPAAPAVIGTQVHVDRDLTVKVFVRVPEDAKGAGVYVSVGKENAKRLSGELQEDGSYLVTYEELGTADMTLVITFTPWALVGQELVRGEECAFSVQDYATRLLRRGNLGDAAHAALIAMLNYGAAVQDLLDYRPYHKPNDYLTNEELVLPPLAFGEEAKGGYYVDPNDPDRYHSIVDFASLAIEQRNNIRFNVYLNVEGQENLRVNGGEGIAGCEQMTPAAEAEALCRGYILQFGRVGENGLPDYAQAIDCEIKKSENGPGYVASSKALSYLSMREEFVVRVLSPDGKESASIYYSVAAFVKTVLESEDAASSEEAHLLHAMLVFGDALSAYADEISE